ncbi:TPA: hypothetical protein ACK210_002625 [Photobacterium damselae subsp. damselae]
MHDYRDDKFYKLYIIIFLVENFCKNRSGRKVLTIKKLEILYFIIKNPVLLKGIFDKLEYGPVIGYKPVLYDNSLSVEDLFSLDNINNYIFYLIDINYICIEQIKGVDYVSINEDKVKDISISPPNQMIELNLKNIKKISTLEESKLTKIIMDI